MQWTLLRQRMRLQPQQNPLLQRLLLLFVLGVRLHCRHYQ
jgi:hypothetical protein